MRFSPLSPLSPLTSFITVIVTLISLNANAFKLSENCNEFGLGKNWYCEEEADTEETEPTANDILKSSMPADLKAAALNELWELQRKKAVITGNKKDLERFLDTQYIIVEKGVDFARKLQRITESNPRFSNPQSYYKNISEQIVKDAENDQLLKESNRRYGVVFIYNSACPYCLRQYPILLNFKAKHGFEILGISVDGNYLEGMDENITDPSITQNPNVQAFPTVMLIDKEKPARIFLSRGLTTLDEIEKRIVNVITEREESDETRN